MAKRLTPEEIDQLLEKYRTSGLTQIEFCRQAGVVLSTLSRHLRRRDRLGQQLIRVKMGPAPADRGFVLVLGNGRRIEAGWQFSDAELARLIRVAEAV